MDIKADISWIQKEIAKISDPELIKYLKSLLKYRNLSSSSWVNEPTADEWEVIDKAEQQISTGSTLSHEEVMANPRKWR
jgi:hypothetical protein